MAKKDDIAAIKAATGVTLKETDYDAAELATLRELAEGGDSKRTEFNAKVEEFKKPATTTKPGGEGEEGEEADGGPTITVKVGDKGSGSYLHPTSKTAIIRGSGQGVKVPDDSWTQDMLAKRFLIEVRTK